MKWIFMEKMNVIYLTRPLKGPHFATIGNVREIIVLSSSCKICLTWIPLWKRPGAARYAEVAGCGPVSPTSVATATLVSVGSSNCSRSLRGVQFFVATIHGTVRAWLDCCTSLLLTVGGTSCSIFFWLFSLKKKQKKRKRNCTVYCRHTCDYVCLKQLKKDLLFLVFCQTLLLGSS